MSAPSPAPHSAEPSSSAVSPPSYAATPAPAATKPADESDEKIAYQKPIPSEGIEPVRRVDDDNLPEVVPEGHPAPANTVANPVGEQRLADSKMGVDEAQHVAPPEQIQTPPPAFQQQPPGYTNGYQVSAATPPVEDITVTPLHLLGDQSDTVDCPFCRRRATTRVEHGASWLTHFVAVCLFFLTFFGAAAPYMLHWHSNIGHWCQNCNRRVAYRNFGSSKMVALGTPDHLREVSKFQAAEPSATTMNPNAAQQV